MVSWYLSTCYSLSVTAVILFLQIHLLRANIRSFRVAHSFMDVQGMKCLGNNACIQTFHCNDTTVAQSRRNQPSLYAEYHRAYIGDFPCFLSASARALRLLHIYMVLQYTVQISFIPCAYRDRVAAVRFRDQWSWRSS